MTETVPHLRSVSALIPQLDERYAKTDTGRSWSWLKEFATFAKKPGGNLKDFWSRLLRVTTRLDTLGMKISEEMIFSTGNPGAEVDRRAITNSVIGTGDKTQQSQC